MSPPQGEGQRTVAGAGGPQRLDPGDPGVDMPVHVRVRAGVDETGPPGVRRPLQHVAGLRFVLRGDHHRIRLDDPRFLEGDRGERGAQVLLVVEIDGRDADGQRTDDVGGVEAAAHAHFEYRDVDLPAPEERERQRRRRFEERRRMLETARFSQRLNRFTDACRFVREGGAVDRTTVDGESFAEIDQVRRGI